MSPKLLHNRPLNDYEINDSFDFSIKATAIKNFLEQNTESLDQNKMLVLYGDWGSGKTSLMRHIENIIDKGIYKPIFFEAWEHEKDQNLALSLCDALTEHIEGNSEIIKNFMKGAFSTLKGFASGITLKSSLLTGLGIDLEFSGKDFVEQLDKSDTPSFYKSNKEFKKSFWAVEKEILKTSGAQKLLVFIDDLDRCEPEHVLNLITALKLFFTYGDKVIFFCGIDKDAVAKAVKTKYNDVVKSEEYLEKVFDIGFNMPNVYSLRKLLLPYFKSKTRLSNDEEIDNVELIEEFFVTIGFTNPRHLKKIFNKYTILLGYKRSNLPSNIANLIPNIINNGDGDVFETIYCLFFLILYDFRPEEFLDIEKYDRKINTYIELYLRDNKDQNAEEVIKDIRSLISVNDIRTIEIRSLLSSSRSPFVKFILFFSHSQPKTFGPIYGQNLSRYNVYFTDSSITTAFSQFLMQYEEALVDIQKESRYYIYNLFNLVRYLL
ncbi:KAP family NTPase [Mucilaginibacter roseus]|uniref:KAP family NTPase n=1 Tax=Mucilaginibacter roseus TaxID=1528868 RepID=A0ABS8U6G8_9SPHI|nr:P-loop NTPase fold protein [Mucilaginibacter roseus]MCD8741449.1 KAP family NTPase [Mucilaginibacter roseus]